MHDIEKKARLKLVEKTDFSSIRDCLVRKDGHDVVAVDRAERMYRQFLRLRVLHPTVLMVPTSAFDFFLHAHTSYVTREFHTFCQFAFGAYMHHDGTMVGTPAYEQGKVDTARLWLEEYGEALEYAGNAFVECAIFPSVEGDRLAA